MDKLLSALPGVLKAVTDPFSLLALITVVLGFVAYSAIRKSGSVKAAGLPAPILALSIIAISLLALAFNVVRVSLPKGSPPPRPPNQINLQVVFMATVRHTVPITVPFSVSSGQLNVGCGESASTSVSWTLPPDAREVNESASWQRTDNLKNNTQSAVVQGAVVTATGSITGQDRQWTGNCPGGGHGELILTGSYIIDKLSGSEAVTLPAFQAIVTLGSLAEVDIPTSADLSDLSCEVTASVSKTDHTTAAYRIEAVPAGTRHLVRISQQGSNTIDTQIAGNKLLIKVT